MNDLDGHQLLETYSSDNPVYVYTKMKAMETISEVLQTRTNPNGYAVYLVKLSDPWFGRPQLL